MSFLVELVICLLTRYATVLATALSINNNCMQFYRSVYAGNANNKECARLAQSGIGDIIAKSSLQWRARFRLIQSLYNLVLKNSIYLFI